MPRPSENSSGISCSWAEAASTSRGSSMRPGKRAVVPAFSDLVLSVRLARLVPPTRRGGPFRIVDYGLDVELPSLTLPCVSTTFPKAELTVLISHLPEFHVLDGRYRVPYGSAMGYQVADLDGDGSVEDWEIETVRQATGSSSYQYKLDCNKDGRVSMEDLALAHGAAGPLHQRADVPAHHGAPWGPDRIQADPIRGD